RTMFVPEDCLDCPQVQRGTAAVDGCLKHLLHVAADREDQVATVFDLVGRVLVTEPTAFLLLKIEREAQTACINPTLADLAQPPYSPLFGQGVCDPRQACSVGDIGKTVALLDEADAGLAGLAGDVLMAVQDHLGGEGRMSADLDGEMAPVSIEDMERVVIDVG